MKFVVSIVGVKTQFEFLKLQQRVFARLYMSDTVEASDKEEAINKVLPGAMADFDKRGFRYITSSAVKLQ
jgi:hypothetical protein